MINRSPMKRHFEEEDEMLDKKILRELETYIQDRLVNVEFDVFQSSERMEERINEYIQLVDLEDFIKTNRQPTLNEVLFHFIDQKGVSDPDIYKRAGIDRKHFSKIRSNPAYRPNKHTILALGLALKLPKKKIEELLSSAGYTLSSSDTCDLVIQFCLKKSIYDIDHVNQALEYFNQKPL